MEPLYEIDESQFFDEIDWIEESRHEYDKAEIRGDIATMDRIERWLGVRKLETNSKELELNQSQDEETVRPHGNPVMRTLRENKLSVIRASVKKAGDHDTARNGNGSPSLHVKS